MVKFFLTEGMNRGLIYGRRSKRKLKQEDAEKRGLLNSVAKKYGVFPQTISAICKNKIYVK